jgi:pullulanase
MDVVYNHTSRRAGFEKLVPGYYFRMTEGGRFSNGYGCGNEFKSENPMARKFIIDSVKFWVTEYQVDGFRFDLMGLTDLETMKRIKSELETLHPGILVYGEPWTGGATPLSPVTDKNQVRGTGIGAFNDGFRDAIKGDRDGGAPGFIQVGDRAHGVVQGLKGAIHDWSVDPADSVNYFEAHDNLTAWDKLLQSAPNVDDEARKRMSRFGALILFVSQGAVFIHSGQEFCRTKRGSHNSYNLPDEINQIDWSLKKENANVYDYYRGLVELRKAHPVLRLRERKDVKTRVSFEPPPNDRCVVYSLDGTMMDEEPADRILVLLNGFTEPVVFDLPDGEWSIHADANRASAGAFGDATGRVELPAHSGMVLVR